MKKEDIDSYVDRYERRLEKFGYSPETLGWGKGGRQEIRFSVLSSIVFEEKHSSVLDVGCGFGDLATFLRDRGWTGSYTGVDLVPGLLSVARERHPREKFLHLDASAGLDSVSVHDFVICSGALNAKLQNGDNESHVEKMLRVMLDRSRIAVAVDFMSTWVDYQHPDAWHCDPSWLLDLVRRLGRRHILRFDYMPYEFSLILFKNQHKNSQNIYSGFNPL